LRASGNFQSRSSDADTSGILLVHKQWSMGYLRFNANNIVKKRKINIKKNTNKLK